VPPVFPSILAFCVVVFLLLWLSFFSTFFLVIVVVTPKQVVSVDGPYGEFLDVDKYDELLLLAGGIGFTPIHSILRQVLLVVLFYLTFF
jgi:hypothetical protein